MFFKLTEISDHPCYKMQEAIECFFQQSITNNIFSVELFPQWFHSTLEDRRSKIDEKFHEVHKLLHKQGTEESTRRSIYELLLSSNKIIELCEGSFTITNDSLDWDSDLGKAIKSLMSSLYDTLDLVVFRRDKRNRIKSRHEFYKEFIKTNKYVCPFCSIREFKNRLGTTRGDLDHYLYKSAYPLSAANMKNLVPTCSDCNQDYKGSQDILNSGYAFYPYLDIPNMEIKVDCAEYPSTENLEEGNWIVTIKAIEQDPNVELKMATWNTVYSVVDRLEKEVAEKCDNWMEELTELTTEELSKEEFKELIEDGRTKANSRALRRMTPSQIIRASFYEFMLTREDSTFFDSFLISLNKRICA